MTQTGLKSQCPQCGGPLRFTGAHSLISVCPHCRSSIARRGVDLASLGKLPDLVAADTRLSLHQWGKLAQLRFQLLGRVQLQQGRASWQEWYVGWSDGSFGWLAEAQGRVILSHRFEQPLRAPTLDSVQPGATFELAGVGTVHVQEVGEARFVSAEGELPFQPQRDASYRFVDGSLAAGGYCTLDYGTAGDDAELFMGRELSYEEAGLDARPLEVSELQARGIALDCPSCGAPLSFKAPDSKTIICPSCRGLCDIHHGKLALVQQLASRKPSLVPLGARGTLYGEELEVIGYMRRLFTSGAERYVWSEYLLHGAAGYRWLTESDGHWTLLKPLSAARVTMLTLHTMLMVDDEKYRHFQSSAGVTSFDLQGEFYWEIRPEDQATLDDFVAPPRMVSRELSGREINWTTGIYLPGEELWSAFKLPNTPPTPQGVAPCQPNPHGARARKLSWISLYGTAALIVSSVLCALFLPHKVVLSVPVPTSGQSPITLSDPFTIEGGTHATTIEAVCEGIHNAWVGLNVALINDETGESNEIDLGVSYYEGYDDGEHWSEGSDRDAERIGSVAPGRYVLRVEQQTETGASAHLPDAVQVRVKHGSFLWFPLWLTLIALWIAPLISWIRNGAFESSRWSKSDHYVSSSSDDDD